MGMIFPSFAVPSITIAGRTFTDMANLIILGCTTSGGAVYSTPRLSNGVGGYQVPAGKTLHIWAHKSMLKASETTSKVQFGYGDTDCGFNNASPPTNPVHMYGSSNFSEIKYLAATNPTTAEDEIAVDFIVPAQKYGFVINSSASVVANMLFYGYLV